MKSILFTLLFLFSFLTSFSQKIRFTDTANRWQSTGFDGSNGPMSSHIYYWISGDSVISGITYRKMQFAAYYGPPGYAYLVREDTVNNMVYYRSHDTDYLLYNYNLHVGDTVHYKGNFSFSSYDSIVRIDSVVSIDSVYYFGAYYKIFTLKKLQSSSQFSFTYIEGIGSFFGPMFPFKYPHFEQSEILRCFSRSGVTDTTGIHYLGTYDGSGSLQPMVYYNNCNYLDVKTIASTKDDIHISPNPCSYQTTITLSNNWGVNASVQIFDLTGRCLYNATPVANTDHMIINTSNFSAGIYIITVQRDNVKTNTKLIVE